MTFKEELQSYFIPLVKEMIEKEESHLIYLKQNLQKIAGQTMIEEMINKSEEYLIHLRSRVEEYTEYLVTL